MKINQIFDFSNNLEYSGSIDIQFGLCRLLFFIEINSILTNT